jgi:hypothetical protein
MITKHDANIVVTFTIRLCSLIVYFNYQNNRHNLTLHLSNCVRFKRIVNVTRILGPCLIIMY